jgi:hypothetical protein
MLSAASPTQDDGADARARLSRHLADGLAAARALVGNGGCDAGCCARAVELTRAIPSASACSEPRRAERTAAALKEHLRLAAKEAAAAAATAEADLLGATVGAAARLAAAVELARSRASDAADARHQLEAATQVRDAPCPHSVRRTSFFPWTTP